MSATTAASSFFFAYITILLLHRVSFAEETTHSPDHDDCTIHVARDLSSTEPLLLSYKSPPEFLYPSITSPRILRFEENEHLRYVCGVNSVHITCKDSKFVMDTTGVKYDMKNIKCGNMEAVHLVKPLLGNCPSNVVCMHIGFQINLLDFVPTIEMIYLNPKSKRPLWTQITVLPIINFRQLRGEDDHYKETDFFNGMSVSMNQVYDKDYQKKKLQQILGSEELATRYIPGPDDHQYLVRGLLIDNYDFFYKPQQDTVHYYENVMPMFRSIFFYNWFYAGSVIRKLASDNRSTFKLWAGTIGTLELEDVKGVKKKIYMATTDTGMKMLAVPKLLFKYAYEPENNRGIVIVTVHNPFLKQLTSDYIVCEPLPICHQLNPIFKDYTRGYTYCCSLHDFAAIASRRGLPAFPHAQPLL